MTCIHCGEDYRSHSRESLNTTNPHGWTWKKDACPIGPNPFHATQTFQSEEDFMREECSQRHIINSSGKCSCDTDLQQRYPKTDWQYEVANRDTILGYIEWVEHKQEADDHWHN